MLKQKLRITNWKTYYKALINSGSVTFWLDNETIQAWYISAAPSSQGRSLRYSDLAITTILAIKRVFRLTPRAAQAFFFPDGGSAALPGLHQRQQSGKVG